MLRVLKAVKLLRLLRLAHVIKFLAEWEQKYLQINSNLSRLLKVDPPLHVHVRVGKATV